MPNKNQFIVEIDGIPSFGAMKADGLDISKHEPSKLRRGNNPLATHGPGNIEIGVVTITAAEEDTEIKQAVSLWHRNYKRRADLAKRGIRVIQMDDAGSSPLSTYEYRGCVPCDFKGSGMDASSSDPASFEFSFQADDYDVY